MILTGKCLQAFSNFLECHKELNENIIDNMDNYPTYKNALIIEFLDSVDIYIDIIRDEGYFEWYVNNIDGDYGFINRQESTIEAIKKANKIYNENKV